jgi:hypothetical protein
MCLCRKRQRRDAGFNAEDAEERRGKQVKVEFQFDETSLATVDQLIAAGIIRRMDVISVGDRAIGVPVLPSSAYLCALCVEKVRT